MKVKIIGAGSIGNHLAQASRRMGWDVVVVDQDPAALERMRRDVYPARYGAWDEAIQLVESKDEPRGGFDIICIGTPPHVRMPIALAALKERPKILQLEKPLCTPLLEGLEEFLKEYQSQTETIAVVGYDHAIAESVEEVARLLDTGIVGEVENVDVEFREHWQGIFKAHPWLSGPQDTYLGYWQKGGGASGEHSHALHLWQYLARKAKLGTWKTMESMLDMKKIGNAEFDALAAFVFRTDTGKIGRVVQDVVTWPVRKWARIQGTQGFVEWLCNGHPDGDVVRHGVMGGDVKEQVFAKKRPDDFYREMKHIQQLMDGTIKPADSPISLESGVAVMRVLALAHEKPDQGVTIA